MKKYVISIIILIIGFSLIGWKIYSDKNTAVYLEDSTASSTTASATSTSTPASTASTSTSALNKAETAQKDQAWDILQKYLAFAKVADISSVSSLSYQTSQSCKESIADAQKASTTGALADCQSKIKNVYTIGSQFKKADFGGVLYDQKQVVLYSGWNPMEGQGIAGFTRQVIYFVKDDSGKLKLLSFNPTSGIFINTAGLKNDEITAKLKLKLKDTDQDMITDDVESCIDQDAGCVKTDPHKRDSNSNGWWDGVEAFFYKK